jgi:hypothetical protein
MLPGIGVGTIMSILAICTGTPLEPLPLLYIMASARWAYGADRLLDGKTEDTPESIAASLLIANLVLWYSDQTKYVAPEILSILMYPTCQLSKVHHQRRLLHRARPVFPRFHANRSVTTL